MLRSLRPPRRIGSINELLQMAPWVTGVKTGHTFGALYVLVGSARRDGIELISVVIGAPRRRPLQRHLDLLEYGFSRDGPVSGCLAGPIRYAAGLPCAPRRARLAAASSPCAPGVEGRSRGAAGHGVSSTACAARSLRAAVRARSTSAASS